MGAAVSTRAKADREHTTFDPSRPGHIIKLIVGLVQQYGALTFEEIDFLLYCFNVERVSDRLGDYLLCAEFAEWIIRDKRGLNTYFCALAQKEAITYKIRADAGVIDKARWQADIADHWKQFDPDRFSSIAAAKGRRIR
jgi:hypothetical protein